MNPSNSKLARLVCSLLVLLLVAAPYHHLFAQIRNVGRRGSVTQIGHDAPSQERLGGSSFGTRSRAEKLPGFMTDMQDQQRVLYQGPTYQVHILGEVDMPGTYRVPASTRLAEAIEYSGGILERGATRTIKLRRRGSKERSVDLMSFQILGNLDHNPYLHDNDVVFIPLKQKIVQISGAVKRPDSYELTKKTPSEPCVVVVARVCVFVEKLGKRISRKLEVGAE